MPTLTQNVALEPGTLTPGQDAALAALLVGQTITAAAKAAGVSRRTLGRWLREDPEFIAALRSYREELRQAINSAMQHLCARAIHVIQTTMVSRKSSPELRLRAAVAVLRLAGSAPANPGATDVEGVRLELAAESRRRRPLQTLSGLTPRLRPIANEEDDYVP